MAKLHFKMRPPVPDYESFVNHTKTLDNYTKAVQSLRGYACAASMLIPSYHLLMAARMIHQPELSYPSYPKAIFVLYMREAMLDRLLIQLRRMYDTDKKSLAAAAICDLLSKEDVRLSLKERSRKNLGWQGSEAEALFESNITFIRNRCALQIKSKPEIKPDDPIVVKQAYLIRRAANKRAAHMTFDEYSITNWDLRSLVVETLVIAKAIQQALGGNDTYPTNYDEIDSGSYQASKEVFGITHPYGPLLNNLDAMLESMRG